MRPGGAAWAARAGSAILLLALPACQPIPAPIQRGPGPGAKETLESPSPKAPTAPAPRSLPAPEGATAPAPQTATIPASPTAPATADAQETEQGRAARYIDLPGVKGFSELPTTIQREFLDSIEEKRCPCGCNHRLAECINEDTGCLSCRPYAESLLEKLSKKRPGRRARPAATRPAAPPEETPSTAPAAAPAPAGAPAATVPPSGPAPSVPVPSGQAPSGPAPSGPAPPGGGP